LWALAPVNNTSPRFVHIERGAKTLALRTEEQNRNTLEIARGKRSSGGLGQLVN